MFQRKNGMWKTNTKLSSDFVEYLIIIGVSKKWFKEGFPDLVMSKRLCWVRKQWSWPLCPLAPQGQRSSLFHSSLYTELPGGALVQRKGSVYLHWIGVCTSKPVRRQPMAREIESVYVWANTVKIYRTWESEWPLWGLVSLSLNQA